MRFVSDGPVSLSLRATVSCMCFLANLRRLPMRVIRSGYACLGCWIVCTDSLLRPEGSPSAHGMAWTLPLSAKAHSEGDLCILVRAVKIMYRSDVWSQ